MTIEQGKLASDFTIISNSHFRAGLTAEAVGVVCYLRSKPRDWKVSPTELSRTFDCSIKRIQRILKELIAVGCLQKVRSRDPVTKRWGSVDYVVNLIRAGKATDPKPTSGYPPVERPPVEKPPVGFAPLLNTESPSTDSTKEDNSHRAACAADARDLDFDDRTSVFLEESKESGDVGTRSDLPKSSNVSRSPKTYRQSPAEAARAWNELRRLDWSESWRDDEMNRWHALLRKGIAADAIVDAAAEFLCKTPWHEVPSLGDFLAGFESYREDDAESVVSPPPILRATTIDDHAC